MTKIRGHRFLEVGLLIASTGLAALGAEVFLRWLYPAPYFGYSYVPPQHKFFQYDPLLGWKGTPEARGVFAGRDFYVAVTHDRSGYRNTTPEYVAGKENLLVVGDSYAWGWGVEDHEVFTAYVNFHSDRFNLYNLAAPGYGTDQEYLTLKGFLSEEGRSDYQGALLIFFFNDFDDNEETVRYSYPKPRFSLRGTDLVLENVPVPQSKREVYGSESDGYGLADAALLNRFHLYNLITQRASWIGQRISSGPPQSRERPPPTEDSHAITLGLLKAMNALCGSNDMFFHVVLLVNSITDEVQQRRMERLADALSTEAIATSFFRSRLFPSSELWLDRHLSKSGHERLAAHALRILRSKSL